jgi:hypothetical protein
MPRITRMNTVPFLLPYILLPSKSRRLCSADVRNIDLCSSSFVEFDDIVFAHNVYSHDHYLIIAVRKIIDSAKNNDNLEYLFKVYCAVF